ncbi:L-threonine ammonia-lyase-like, partial [Temnothorax longispinosus]|uniref:L-threonine ammonia-lyase-like n=1 Tax=Temnothorax longispinosus TaxID=300112 RepID=UPI003A99A6E1
KESEQETNECSVKARGVIYTLLQLSKKQKKKGLKGVIAISTGNFAQILCYYGKKFQIPVTVVVPTTTPDEIVRMFRDLSSDHADDANSRVTVHVENHPDIILGQASLDIEMMEDIKPDVVMLPTMIDGCGLTTGKNWIEVQMATVILKAHNIDDPYAALGLAPFLLGELNKLKGK